MTWTGHIGLPLFPATGGSIVNISSVVSTLAPPAAAIYVGTKGAVDSITKSLAKEFAPRKIRVNGVNPGFVLTEGTHSAGMAGLARRRTSRPRSLSLPLTTRVGSRASRCS